MKLRFVFACAAAGVALTAIGAGTASAEGVNGTVEITPNVARAGELVTITATCDAATHGGSESWALTPVSYLDGYQDEAGVWQLTATARVDDVKPGEYTAMISCGDETFTGAFRVEGAKDVHAAIGIDDDEILPGQEVRVAANCQDPNFVSSPVTSPVLSAPDIAREKGAPINNPMFSMGRIDKNAKAGTYPISFNCAGRTVTGEFEVTSKTRPVAPPKTKAQIPVKPKGAADTGSLDSPAAKTVAPAEESGPNALVIGGTALAALATAGGLGVFAYRRRQRA